MHLAGKAAAASVSSVGLFAAFACLGLRRLRVPRAATPMAGLDRCGVWLNVELSWTDLAASLTNEEHGHVSTTSATPNVYRISDMLTRRCSHVLTLRLDHNVTLPSARKNGHLGVGRNETAEAKEVPKREGAQGA